MIMVIHMCNIRKIYFCILRTCSLWFRVTLQIKTRTRMKQSKKQTKNVYTIHWRSIILSFSYYLYFWHFQDSFFFWNCQFLLLLLIKAYSGKHLITAQLWYWQLRSKPTHQTTHLCQGCPQQFAAPGSLIWLGINSDKFHY